MKNLFCYLFLLVFAVTASAQKVYFVYFEADNTQPFYLKMDDRVYTSTATGFFILPNLADSTYNMSIGFPSTTTESKFKLTVNGKDHGYAIKNFDFGWGLYDLQSSSVTRPEADNWKKTVTYQYRNNEFTTLLAKASNDTTLFYVPVFNKEEEVVQNTETQPQPASISAFDTAKTANVALVAASGTVVSAEGSGDKTDPPIALVAAGDSLVNKEPVVLVKDSVVTTDSTALVSSDSTTKPISTDSSLVAPIIGAAAMVQTDSLILPGGEFRRSVVRLYYVSSTSEGYSLVYHDVFDNVRDTISLIIPNPPILLNKADTAQFEDGMLEIKKDSIAPVAMVTGAGKTVPKSNCTGMASANDFLKLRKNMAAKSNDEDMIREAKKTFRLKCFSTGQIKNLSSLFLNDEGKYQFFDAAYTHVTDQEVFYALQAELKDEYYIKRFKALIGE
jgi:Domain of unknown function (DUF4476)